MFLVIYNVERYMFDYHCFFTNSGRGLIRGIVTHFKKIFDQT